MGFDSGCRPYSLIKNQKLKNLAYHIDLFLDSIFAIQNKCYGILYIR